MTTIWLWQIFTGFSQKDGLKFNPNNFPQWTLRPFHTNYKYWCIGSTAINTASNTIHFSRFPPFIEWESYCMWGLSLSHKIPEVLYFIWIPNETRAYNRKTKNSTKPKWFHPLHFSYKSYSDSKIFFQKSTDGTTDLKPNVSVDWKSCASCNSVLCFALQHRKHSSTFHQWTRD